MKTPAWTSTCVGLALVMSALLPTSAQAVVRGKPVHGLALYGEPKFGPDAPFPHNNANAPKGGSLRLTSGAQTFDSFNPFSIKGVAAAGLSYLGGAGPFVEGLTMQGDDEPFTQYCLLCETMTVAEDNASIEYTLRAEAKFHDGTPVTPEDVVASFNLLVTKGIPMYRLYWGDVEKVEKTGDRQVKFTFKNGNNAELPLIIGQMPVLSKAFWDTHDLSESTLDKPNSTGPYLIDSFEPGRFVQYKRNPNYWGKDLPVLRGTYNFDEVRFEYFRDDTVAFEAFKTGAYDLHYENTARRWATGYDFPAMSDGRVKKLEVEDGTPMSAQGFIYNLRRDKFADRRVREALNLAFDFESLNKTIFYEQYARLRSYFQHSDLEATGLPSAEELKLLEPLRDKIPPEVFTQEFKQPTTAGDGNTRDNLLKARDLLTAAGWEIVNGQLTNKKTGAVFTFEVLETQSTLDRIINPWLLNLEKLGIKGTLRVVDTSQMLNRMNEFDYDVTVSGLTNSLSPGNEQYEYWGTAAADRSGSRNYSGVKDPAVDALIDALVKAPDRTSLVTASRALDRVLVWNYYTGLQYGPASNRYAYWTKLEHTGTFPLHGMGAPGIGVVMSNWWMGSAAAQTRGTAAAPAEGKSNIALVIALVVAAAGIIGFVFLRRRRA